MAPILTELGLPGSDILEQPQSKPIKTRATEMFWGNDRLDGALLFASERTRRHL
jgi:hypothetical protein